ncbi:Hypothetical predicted protein [Cloeon dipterum]|uniref:F-box/LRR-repeat protein 15-like leucin rich repeat domain-containing protein n=1 Tax=Cloeon dipterum TaxID=197152 RepID=A0A8S1CA72_9INSE|nr:Hypothetical predicted protein [Cloeon dipterum]
MQAPKSKLVAGYVRKRNALTKHQIGIRHRPARRRRTESDWWTPVAYTEIGTKYKFYSPSFSHQTITYNIAKYSSHSSWRSSKMAIYYVDNAYYAALEYLEDDDGGDQPARAVIPPNPLDLIDKQTYICRKSRAVNLMSLKQICLENVAQNMDSVWCKDFVENWSGQIMLYFLGPFEQIAGGCVFELMELLRSKNCLHYRYLPSLITGQFRCEVNLKILNLENCSGMKESNLCLTLQNLKRLEQLNLRNTGISDNILESIGSCTFPLQRLQVSDNEKITNQGVSQLCNKHFAIHLKAVSVEFTDVNIEGIFHLLESLPKLEVLEHIFTTDAVLNWKLKYRDEVLNLRQLKLDLSAYTNEELFTLVMTCKQLTDISFTSSAAVTQDALLPFLDMAKVSKLSSNCVLIPEISWFMHLGQSMTHIDIGCVNPCATQIDLTIIGSSCPNLLSLSLRNVHMVETSLKAFWNLCSVPASPTQKY